MARHRSGGNSWEFIELVGNAPDDVITSGSARARSQSSSTGWSGSDDRNSICVQCISVFVCSVFLYLWAVYLYESPSTSWSWSDDRRRPPEFIRFQCIQLWDSDASNVYLLGSDASNKSGVPILMHQLSLEPVGSITLQIQIPSSLNFRNCQSHNFDSSHHQASSRRGNWEMAIWCED